MRQIVTTEKMLDQLVGEAQDRIGMHIRASCGHTEEGKRAARVATERAKEIVWRLGQDIKDSTL